VGRERTRTKETWASDVPAHLEPTPDGQAYEVVPVLSQGKIHFSLGAIFKDRSDVGGIL
jgi:hypothetical protein